MDKAPITVAIDAMGGDHGLEVTVPAALAALKKYPKLKIILVGLEDAVREELANNKASEHPRLEVQHASEVVGMDELPSQALRGKKDSSMRVAINLVKEGQAQACVSAGNTGALMATSRFVLKTLPGIERPAICTALPTMKGHAHVLDLGANIDSEPQHLLQFAVMGSVLAGAVDNNQNPTVGLLNIGEEEIKGIEMVKDTAKLLKGSPLNYYGFVEGDDIYKGTTDVVVCDGFVGNVMLKAAEGVARMMSYYLKREFNRNLFTKLAALIALPVLKAFKGTIDTREYNGASLLGLNGIVIRSHGNADAYSFRIAIQEAVKEVDKNVPEQIRNQVEKILVQRAVD